MAQIDQPKTSFVIALPMYNEQDYAEKCLQAIFPVLDGMELPNAVVAINDGSRDNTLAILERLQPGYERLHIVDHHVNRGYGAAIRSAYQFGIEHGFDYVLFMDADMTQDPKYILGFLPHMMRGVDFIKASRYIKGSQVIGVPRFRVAISSMGNMFARLAFRLPVTDYTNGFRAVRTSIARDFELHENRFPVLVEEMWQVKYLARTFGEVCYSLSSRTNAGDSKFRYDFNVYKHYLKYCFLALLHIKPKHLRKQEDQ
jgi:glycosyltransferase involved in cell wall biosynthesis